MDPISDMLNRIINAQAVGHAQVQMPFSNVKFRIAQLLRTAGYLGDIERTTRTTKRKTELPYLTISLKYADGLGAISGMRIMSRPSRHLYIKASAIRPVRSGHGTAVISTSQGIMTSQEARKAKLGGEIMFEIW